MAMLIVPSLRYGSNAVGRHHRFVDFEGDLSLGLDCADEAFVLSRKIGVAGTQTEKGAIFRSLVAGSTALFYAARTSEPESTGNPAGPRLVWYVELTGKWEYPVVKHFTCKGVE